MKSNPSPSAPLNLCPPTGVTGTTLPDSFTMALTEHTLTEWARLAADAYKAGHTMIGDKFSTSRTCPAGSRLPIREFDALQAVYCGWLALGWVRALEVWSEWFPTSPIYSQPEPLPASPVKDTPTFSVGDVVRVISPELHQADMRHYPGNEGIVCDVLPDVRKRYVYVCTGLGSWFEDQIELVSRAPASPVDSVGVPVTYKFVGTKELDSEILHITAEGSLVIGRITLREPFRSEMLSKLNSHAAKDAKIKELESLLLECVRDMTAAHIVDNILYKEKNPTRPQLPEPASLIAARAALALPCAPLGS